MRKNISINDVTDNRAKELAEIRGVNGLSDLASLLINEEWVRRGGKLEIREKAPPYTVNSGPPHTAGMPPAAANAPVVMPPNVGEIAPGGEHAAPDESTKHVRGRKTPPPIRKKKK